MTTSYFYIIKHKNSGKKYCGSRRAKGCHPKELLQPDGYHTSSKIVNKIIVNEGLDAFEIVEIVETDNALEYESTFQKTHNCAKSPEWFNLHNGELSECLDEWLEANEVTSAMQIPKIQKKQFARALKTVHEKYGVEHIMKIPEFVKASTEASRKTMMERYGVESNLQIPWVIEKIKDAVKQTNIENYGCEYTWQRPDVIDKCKTSRTKTMSERYGVENISQLKETQEKIKKNSLLKYGCEHPSQSEDLKQRKREKALEKYGVENYWQTEEGRKRMSERMKKNPPKSALGKKWYVNTESGETKYFSEDPGLPWQPGRKLKDPLQA